MMTWDSHSLIHCFVTFTVGISGSILTLETRKLLSYRSILEFSFEELLNCYGQEIVRF